MNLLRWNNAQGPQGKSVEPSASHSGQGLRVKERFSTSGRGRSFFLTSPLQKNSFKRESPRSGVQVWQPFFGVIGFVVGGIFPRSTQSLCPHMLDRISACDRQVERAGEPWQ